MSKTINSVVQKNLCSGCGICAGMFDPVAAVMKISPAGFLRPQALRKLNGSERKLFNEICPGVKVSHSSNAGGYMALFGRVKEVMIGYAMNEEVRFKGASGGVVSALAIDLLETNQVQGVLHIVPSEQNPLENVTQISRSREEVLRGAGSRYAPAASLTRVSDCMNLEGQFAFIGKPCEIAALRALGLQCENIKKKFPFLIAIMCAGTPSLHGTETIIKKMGFDLSEISLFRYRGNGWPGKTRAETKDGRIAEMDYNSAWGKVLNRHIQFRCKICPDGTGEFADVSCADAWHADEKGYPLFTERAGQSIVLIRTDIGLQLVKNAEINNKLNLASSSLEEVEKMQPYQVQRKKTLFARLLGFTLAGKATPVYRNFGLIASARRFPFSKQIKAAVGSWLRGLRLNARS